MRLAADCLEERIGLVFPPEGRGIVSARVTPRMYYTYRRQLMRVNIVPAQNVEERDDRRLKFTPENIQGQIAM
jgi:hypothetical protein